MTNKIEPIVFKLADVFKASFGMVEQAHRNIRLLDYKGLQKYNSVEMARRISDGLLMGGHTPTLKDALFVGYLSAAIASAILTNSKTAIIYGGCANQN